jgi:Uma2 family endonuclease
MGTQAIELLTLEEFLARPDRDDDQREELIEGELIVSPGATAPHAKIVRLFRRHLAALEEQGYVLVNDSSCVLPPRSMPVPDLAAVRLERWRHAVKTEDWLTGFPELVIEVSSPSNRRLQRKADVYFDHGAEQVWIVYRKTRTVTVVTTEGSKEARLGEAVEFHGVRVPVASIFPE